MEQILESSRDDVDAAQQLIDLLPTVPPAAQVEAAHHISDLLEDKDYGSAMPVLLNARMPEEVLSVLFTDLMARSDSVKLHAFLDVAQIADHPFSQEARGDLELFLESDYGADWNRWHAAVESYLQNKRSDASRP